MPKIKFTHGRSIETLIDELKSRQAGKIFVVSSERAWATSELSRTLATNFPGLQYTCFQDFGIGPQFEDIWRGCLAFQQARPDIILALGGGTAIDVAKSISLLNPLSRESASDVIMSNSTENLERSTPLIVIPTTAGSGSEATHFAVLYLEGKKFSLANSTLLPDLSLVDGMLSADAPQNIAAACGMDALCQSIESYWAVGATKQSRLYAKDAIKLLTVHLKNAVNKRSPLDCCKVAEAASLAGQAINISKTTAAHAYSYYLTSRHNIPHGHAVSLCLPGIAFNNYYSNSPLLDKEELEKRFSTLFKLCGVTTIESFLNWFSNVMNDLGLDQDLLKLGFKEDELPAFMKSVNIERMANNPAEVDPDVFSRQLLKRVK